MSTFRTSVARTAALLALLSAISGCTRETQDGDSTVFRWDWWVPVLVVVGGIACFFLGLFMSRLSTRLSSPVICRLLARFGLASTFFGPLVGIILVPTLFNDKVTVNQDGFTFRMGLWWSPTVYDARFAALSRIEVVPKETGHEKTEYYLVCIQKEGGYEAIPDNGLMKRGGADKILQTARQLGIPVEKHPVEEKATFAAIAYSRSTGTFGSSSDCSSLAEAERVARSHCKANDARVVTWSRNAWCALAVAEDKAFGYSHGHSSAEAERQALAHCREFTKAPCHVAVSVFSGAVPAP